MKLPLQISFRNCPKCPSAVNAIKDRATQLEKYFPRIMGCRVVVETPHRHQHKGNRYRVVVNMTVPGREMVAGKKRNAYISHDHVFVAIRDSFNAARRKLQDTARRRRGSLKVQLNDSRSKCISLSPEGYGFILSANGKAMNVHGEGVFNGGFKRLDVGDEAHLMKETL